MEEIRIDYEKLENELKRLMDLKAGTGHRIHKTYTMLTCSNGKTFRATNNLFAELETTEQAMYELINETIDYLELAGISFSEAEADIARKMDDNVRPA